MVSSGAKPSRSSKPTTASSSVPMRYVFVPGPVMMLGLSTSTRRTSGLSTTTSPGVMVMVGSSHRRPAGKAGQGYTFGQPAVHRVLVPVVAWQEDADADVGGGDPRQDR